MFLPIKKESLFFLKKLIKHFAKKLKSNLKPSRLAFINSVKVYFNYYVGY